MGKKAARRKQKSGPTHGGRSPSKSASSKQSGQQSVAGLILGYALQASRGRDISLWAYMKERNPFVFAHHPSDACFCEHVWCWGGMYFCKGCVMTFSGILLGLILQLATGWLGRLENVWSTWGVACVFAGMLLPTIVTGVMGGPRWLKHICRLTLGVLVASAFCMLFVTPYWWVRIVIVSMFFAVKIPMERLRRKQMAKQRAGRHAR